MRTFSVRVCVAAFGLAIAGALPVVAGGDTTVEALAGKTHFHGLAADRRGNGALYLATHHGLYAVSPDGSARRVSQARDDYMGFTPHPADPSVLYASGHPAGGGNLGFLISRNGGVTWSKLADGAGGPVDFHQMDVSKANPAVIYGAHGGLQRSRDGGQTWERIGPAPEGLIDLAASAEDPDRLYAATQRGLMLSTDGGRGWQPTRESGPPATMVQTTRDGGIYAFVVGSGLLRARESDLEWETVSNAFGITVVLHFAMAPSGQESVLYAVTYDPGTRSQALRTSRDGGESWTKIGAASH